MRRALRHRLTAVLALTVTLLGVGPARADIAQPRTVSADPVDWTPHVLDGTVWAIAVVGDTVVVGGDFTAVTDSTGRLRYPRRHLFAYGLRDGVVRAWAPAVDAPVYALAAGLDNTVYVGGYFKTVNGAASRGLARLSLATGARDTSFRAAINWGDVRALARHGDRLYAGGTFSAINGVPRTALARLSASTGAVDTGFDARLAAPTLSRTRVEDFALSPDGRRLVVGGAIQQAGGRDRIQLAMIDSSGPGAVVTDWYTDSYRPQCLAGFETYIRGIDFSPLGDYFVVTTTGRTSSPTRLCDTAARFEAAGVGRRAPTWVNHTGGDSLYAVAVTGSTVYVGGHQRWMNNPHGNESAGPGAVARPGIAALDPRTGKALAWNPTRDRGVGVRAFVATSIGLLVGSDTTRLGREYHGRLGMFPLS
ncbi:MAG TPA: delta-60 repeat domain-containing protein [Pilimelia sp.]|nr:delta-60 repeat domain-containing protein [Pilimelia sp.]